MSEAKAVEVPQTLEGYYVLHDIYRVDWTAWKRLGQEDRERISASASEWLAAGAALERGDSQAYSVITQKGDLMLIHYREDPDGLNRAELELRNLELFDYLQPAYSYFSVVEVSLYEVQAMAHRRLAEKGLRRGGDGFEEAFEAEMERQKDRMSGRLFRDVPPQHYACFYPMSKRRGEHVNWYTMPLDERRAMMRNHGSIGHKYHEVVTQVIAGSVGFDDWEWGVTLHSDDALVFKKLIYEMRFDPASALFAEFGPFYVGMRVPAGELADLLRVTGQ